MKTRGGLLLLIALGTKLTLVYSSGCSDDKQAVVDDCIDCGDANLIDHIFSSDDATVSDSGDDTIETEIAFCQGDRVWYDSINDLCWQNPHPESVFSWDQAILHCERLSLAGHEDWELPNADQLRSLIRSGTGSAESNDKPHCVNNIIGGACQLSERAPACIERRCVEECGACKEGEGPGKDGCYWDPELDDSCIDHGFWSSSMIADHDGVWGVDYKTAVIGTASVSRELFVRCVRSGPQWQNYMEPDYQPDGGPQQDGGTKGDASTDEDSGPGKDARVDSDARTDNDATPANDAGSFTDKECNPGLYQGFLQGTYLSPLGLGSIAISGTIFFRLTESEQDMLDITQGSIESSGGVAFEGTFTGRLDCQTGQTVDLVSSGSYSYYSNDHAFSGTMSGSYNKDNWSFEGTWQADDQEEGYGGSGTWEANWVEP